MGIFSSVVPAYAKGSLALSTGSIGLLLLMNAATVVVAQVPVARLIEGRRRALSLAFGCLCWVVAYALVASAQFAGRAAFGVLLLAAALVAIGECFHAVALAPLVAQLAPPELRGRYMATIGLSFLLGLALGPSVGVQLLSHSPNAAFIGTAALAACAAISVLALEHGLPHETRVTPRASSLDRPGETLATDW